MTGVEFTVERTFPASLDRVAEAVAWTRLAAGGAELPGNRLLHLELAVEEAVANIVRHAYPGPPGSFRIRIHGEPGVARVEIDDEGVPFDPSHRPDPGPPSSGPRKAGGLGVLLLRRVTEGLDYRRDGTRNRLSFEISSGRR